MNPYLSILLQFCLRLALNVIISSRSLSFPLSGRVIFRLQMNISPKEKSRWKHPMTVPQSHGSPSINEKESYQDKTGLTSSSLKKKKIKEWKVIRKHYIILEHYVKKNIILTKNVKQKLM